MRCRIKLNYSLAFFSPEVQQDFEFHPCNTFVSLLAWNNPNCRLYFWNRTSAKDSFKEDRELCSPTWVFRLKSSKSACKHSKVGSHSSCQKNLVQWLFDYNLYSIKKYSSKLLRLQGQTFRRKKIARLRQDNPSGLTCLCTMTDFIQRIMCNFCTESPYHSRHRVRHFIKSFQRTLIHKNPSEKTWWMVDIWQSKSWVGACGLEMSGSNAFCTKTDLVWTF